VAGKRVFIEQSASWVTSNMAHQDTIGQMIFEAIGMAKKARVTVQGESVQVEQESEDKSEDEDHEDDESD
jgi:hypothetical protein